MNKLEILEKLENLNLDKKKYIVISGASLVVQGIIKETPDIDLATTLDYYSSLNYPTKIGGFGKEIKYLDNIEISDNLYDENYETIEVNGYKFLNLKDILKIKKMLNRPKDKHVINKLENLLKIKKMWVATSFLFIIKLTLFPFLIFQIASELEVP